MTVSPMPVLAAGLLLLSGVLGACASTTTPSVTDGQSHWLQECASDSECGPLECICGTCTLKCSQADECKAALGDDVACTPAKDVDEAMCEDGSKPRICAQKGSSAPGPDGGSNSSDGGGEASLEPEVDDGDGTCAKGETPENAPSDCEEPDDGLCTGSENVWNAAGDCGTVQRVSVRDDGAELASGSDAFSISADGSRVAFNAKRASGERTDNRWNAYVRDFARGETILASPRSLDVAPTGDVRNLVLTDDGQWVVFTDASADFSVADTNGLLDVYATHLESGEIVRVSLQADGSQYTKDCADPAVSRDSRFVRFRCGRGSTLVHSAYDLDARQIVDPAGIAFGAAFDASGTLEVVESNDALVPDDVNGSSDIYLENHADGTTERISMRSDGIGANSASQGGSISLDGRFVAFASLASNLAPDPNRSWDIFVRDRISGEILRASVRSDGGDASVINQGAKPEANAAHLAARISGNGEFVAVESQASNLVDGDTNDTADIYLINISDWVDSLPPAN